MRVSSPRRHRNHLRQRPPSEPPSRPEDRVYSRILDTLDVGVAHVSPDGNLLYANPSFLNVIGATPLDVDRINLKAFIAPGSWAAFETALRQASRGPVEGEMTVERFGSSVRSLQLAFSPLRVGATTTIGIVALDVTELVRAKQALQDSEKSLQALSGTILRLQDEERRRIARDLHDSIGQELAVLSISLTHLDKELEKCSPDVRHTVLDSADLLSKVQEEIRTISYLLHPPMLEELGLAWPLEWYVKGFQKRSGIQVELEMNPKPSRFSPEKEIAIFRLVQECLTNVLRHSGSQKALVRLSVAADIQVSVQDEGTGIPPDVLRSITEKSFQLGVGIPGMRERLTQLGGTLQIHSGNSGTTISATLPLDGMETAPSESDVLQNSSPANHETPARPGSSAPRKRVLIADDHQITREGLKTLLATQPDIEVCGEASDGLAAVSLVDRLKPDLVILDSSMPRAGGFYAAHLIREAGNLCKILIFADQGSPHLERTVNALRCDGYVMKSNLAGDFLRGVRSVLAGHSFSPSPQHTTPDASPPVSEEKGLRRRLKGWKNWKSGRS